jgi:formate hydrogenlyase subunit 6/NADH:ubiquinone oxidoreductase subunit I
MSKEKEKITGLKVLNFLEEENQNIESEEQVEVLRNDKGQLICYHCGDICPDDNIHIGNRYFVAMVVRLYLKYSIIQECALIMILMKILV